MYVVKNNVVNPNMPTWKDLKHTIEWEKQLKQHNNAISYLNKLNMHTYIQLHNIFYKVIHIHTHTHICIHTHMHKNSWPLNRVSSNCESACTWIFFNTKCSTMWSVFGWDPRGKMANTEGWLRDWLLLILLSATGHVINPSQTPRDDYIS